MITVIAVSTRRCLMMACSPPAAGIFSTCPTSHPCAYLFIEVKRTKSGRPCSAVGEAGLLMHVHVCPLRAVIERTQKDVQSLSRKNAANVDHRFAAAAVVVHRRPRGQELSRSYGQCTLP